MGGVASRIDCGLFHRRYERAIIALEGTACIKWALRGFSGLELRQIVFPSIVGMRQLIVGIVLAAV
jgi:hypothetical protein